MTSYKSIWLDCRMNVCIDIRVNLWLEEWMDEWIDECQGEPMAG